VWPSWTALLMVQHLHQQHSNNNYTVFAVTQKFKIRQQHLKPESLIGTVHTSAKARLTSVVTRIRIRDTDRHQNLVICSLAHCQPSLKISCSFCAKLLTDIANGQTDRQTDKQITITSLAEVIKCHSMRSEAYTLNLGSVPSVQLNRH